MVIARYTKIASPTRLLWIGLIVWISFPFILSAQDCGTSGYMRGLYQKGAIHESDADFENWIGTLLKNSSRSKNSERSKSKSYRVQVVVHVIHNGEAVGTGANISNSQVFSQIDVLNKDFKRLNTDAALTPSDFLGVASGFDIDFVLAAVDPDGLPTNGINRVNGNRASWSRDEDELLKSLSYWPAENYLNIWVCDLSDFRGYAQFPQSTLPGVETSPTNRLTDGIVVGYRYFGSVDDGNFALNTNYNKGRTATHEIGHFLGLRHIWGDEDDCSGTDYVEDTPPQAGSTIGCPIHPQSSCPDENPINKMFQNYMDFTYDFCMNLFTQNQVDRMQIVLENSPRRASLLYPLIPEPLTYDFEKIFSPNGDGINDYWRWTNTLKYDGCRLTIFNRFGKPVYEKVSYDNSWDGRSSDGFILEAGPYYFVIKCDGTEDLRGGVRIIR
jgi:gliding motility-associated-like protein